MSRPRGRWSRLYGSRQTVRARLALLYAVGFFGSGLVLLAIPIGFVHGSSSSAVSARPGPPGTRVSVIARSQHSTDLHNVVVGSLIALVVLAFVSTFLGWLMAGRLLRPLRTITEDAREISASNLHRRLDLTGPNDEFKELGLTLNDLFARLEASFEAQRRFVANASHELRTPLAAERTVLQVALADPGANDQTLREACQQVIALGEHQEHLISALLTLASTARGLERRERCNLAAIASAVVQARGEELEHRQLAAVTAYGAAVVEGDPRLLESLVANLVDNAIRHNVSGGRLEVTTGLSPAGRPRVFVGNGGPVIAPDQVDGLFVPFQRLGADRTGGPEGHGIGLAVVEAIATAHGADITVDPRPGGGLDITTDFPLAGDGFSAPS